MLSSWFIRCLSRPCYRWVRWKAIYQEQMYSIQTFSSMSLIVKSSMWILVHTNLLGISTRHHSYEYHTRMMKFAWILINFISNEGKIDMLLTNKKKNIRPSSTSLASKNNGYFLRLIFVIYVGFHFEKIVFTKVFIQPIEQIFEIHLEKWIQSIDMYPFGRFQRLSSMLFSRYYMWHFNFIWCLLLSKTT